jgi:hypothetical protein
MRLGEHKEVEGRCLVGVGSCKGQDRHVGWWFTLLLDLALVLLLDVRAVQCCAETAEHKLFHGMQRKPGALEMLLQ